MPRKGHSEEQIIFALRQAEAGKKVGDICREKGSHVPNNRLTRDQATYMPDTVPPVNRSRHGIVNLGVYCETDRMKTRRSRYYGHRFKDSPNSPMRRT